MMKNNPKCCPICHYRIRGKDHDKGKHHADAVNRIKAKLPVLRQAL